MDSGTVVTASNVEWIEAFLNEAQEILRAIDRSAVARLVDELCALRDRGGRLFVVGVGGGAGHASHAVCDFRKLAGIEAYAPTDNVSELTARTNDEGWETSFRGWLETSRLNAKDALLVFSVGGGSVEHNISTNIVRAVQYAREVGATTLGVVGRDGGYTATVAKACVVVPAPNPATVTPHTEAFQSVIWHLLVSHPAVQRRLGKWESTSQ